MTPWVRELHKRHMFILAIKQINDRLVVYRTKPGPIFAMFGINNTIRLYIHKEADITSFYCSHDLRKGTQGDDKKRLAELLRLVFKKKQVPGIIKQIVDAGKFLESIEMDENFVRELLAYKARMNTTTGNV